jgi:type III pantothenate kinase
VFRRLFAESEVFYTLLAVDVGNTCIVMGFFDHDTLVRTLSVPYDKTMEAGDIRSLILGSMNKASLEPRSVKKVAISNVVSRLNPLFSSLCDDIFGSHPIFVNHRSRMELTIDIENPAELGPDLIVSAVAAYRNYKDSLVIVDLGTATKFSLISAEGVFRGVIIAPGLGISADSLKARIPYLPEVPLEIPSLLLGRNSVQSIQSGLMIGHCAMIEGVLVRLARTFGKPARTILCGGFSPLFRDQVEGIDDVDPDLILKGIAIIGRDNWGS